MSLHQRPHHTVARAMSCVYDVDFCDLATQKSYVFDAFTLRLPA